MHWLVDNADERFLLDSQALYDTCVRSARYTHYNQVHKHVSSTAQWFEEEEPCVSDLVLKDEDYCLAMKLAVAGCSDDEDFFYRV